MNEKTIVVYYSKYGTTKEYAKWISKELDCRYYPIEKVKKQRFEKVDTIIFGAGIYVGSFKQYDFLENHKDKNLIVFTVGLSNPKETDYSEIIERNFNEELRSKIKFFHLRGGMDYKNLSIKDNLLMYMLKKFHVEKKVKEDLTNDDILMLETYGKKLEFLNKDDIKIIIDYINY